MFLSYNHITKEWVVYHYVLQSEKRREKRQLQTNKAKRSVAITNTRRREMNRREKSRRTWRRGNQRKLMMELNIRRQWMLRRRYLYSGKTEWGKEKRGDEGRRKGGKQKLTQR